LNPKDRRINDNRHSNVICQTEVNVDSYNNGNYIFRVDSKVSIHTTATESNNDVLNKSLQNSLRETISNKSTLKRNLDNIASFQNKEELIQTIQRSKSQDRFVEEYTIENVNYDAFNLKEFKSVFSKNRIHLFDVNLTGNYGQGNSKGKVTYKIRKTAENNKNLQDVNQQLTNKLKLKTKVTNKDKKTRSITDVVPLNTKLDCNNGDVDKFRKHLLAKNISSRNSNSNYNSSRLSTEDKYSSNKIQFNFAYKAINKRRTPGRSTNI